MHLKGEALFFFSTFDLYSAESGHSGSSGVGMTRPSQSDDEVFDHNSDLLRTAADSVPDFQEEKNGLTGQTSVSTLRRYFEEQERSSVSGSDSLRRQCLHRAHSETAEAPPQPHHSAPSRMSVPSPAHRLSQRFRGQAPPPLPDQDNFRRCQSYRERGYTFFNSGMTTGVGREEVETQRASQAGGATELRRRWSFSSRKSDTGSDSDKEKSQSGFNISAIRRRLFSKKSSQKNVPAEPKPSFQPSPLRRSTRKQSSGFNVLEHAVPPRPSTIPQPPHWVSSGRNNGFDDHRGSQASLYGTVPNAQPRPASAHPRRVYGVTVDHGHFQSGASSETDLCRSPSLPVLPHLDIAENATPRGVRGATVLGTWSAAHEAGSTHSLQAERAQTLGGTPKIRSFRV